MSHTAFRQRRPIAWLALIAILLVALAPTVSQFAMSLRHGGHHAHEHTASMPADEHAGHASHTQPANDAPPEDCWSACGYCDLFSHVPALELPPCGELAAADLPAIAIDSDRRAPASVVHRRAAQPRGPPLPFA